MLAMTRQAFVEIVSHLPSTRFGSINDTGAFSGHDHSGLYHIVAHNFIIAQILDDRHTFRKKFSS